MKKTKKFWAVLAAAGLLAASFAGCGSNASANAGSSSGSAVSSSAEGSSASDSGEKKVIKAVTSGTLAPYFYVNDDSELTGVDIDIVKEVFNRLPQYELKIEQAVRLLLEGIGEDITREGLIDTPDRIARMCEEIYGGLGHEADQHLLKQFPVENNEIVLEKDITFYSMCEHHLMPFYGKAHLAYIPNGKVTGLSKLARTVEVYSRRPQIQERLTVQIADALERTLDPKGIMVMLEAEHTCMTMRGIKKPGSKTITTVTRGAFTEDKELQKMFLSMVKG